MTFRNRILLTFFTFVMLPLTLAFLSIGFFLSARFEDDFKQQMIAHGDIVASAFARLENLHEQRAMYALRQLEREPGVWNDKAALIDFTKRFGLSYVAVTDSRGHFLKDSSEHDPPKNDKTLLNFCSEYALLPKNPNRIEVTPILLSYPDMKPYKFVMKGTTDGARILEVAIHLDDLNHFLKGMLTDVSRDSRISFYTANGDFLASSADERKRPSEDFQFSGSSFLYHVAGESSVLAKRVNAKKDHCCECKVKNLTNASSGNYYYVAQIERNRGAVTILQTRLTNTLIFVFVLVSVLVFVASIAVSSALSRRLQNLGKAVASLQAGEVNQIQFNGDDEIASLSKAFSALLTQLTLEKNRTLDLEKNAAIARVTQFVAHDVRKPFSLFKSIIKIVEGTRDPNQVREVLSLALPEVNQAMVSVEGMLMDVMQIGSDAKMNLEAVSPEALLESAVYELFSVHTEVDVDISYDFAHRNKVMADPLRVGRVFANILENAIHAMGAQGRLFVRTRERDGFVEFTLGNEGSEISPENISKLFDAFFTSGKKRGTGLGLAIAKKTIDAHGGSIRCESEKSEKHPTGLVEFVFTLPASKEVSVAHAKLMPRSSHEAQTSLAARADRARQSAVESNEHEPEIEGELRDRLEKVKLQGTDQVSVLVIDDEAFYRQALQALIERSESLSSKVRLVFAKNDIEALTQIQEQRFSLVIADVDLGPLSKNGLDIVMALRKLGFSGHICVHSNRFLSEDSRSAITAGADTVLPKPMGRTHFLKLLLASLAQPQISFTKPESLPRALSVALVDDSVSMRFAWKSTLDDHTHFRSFPGTSAFFEACRGDPSYLSTLDVVITDYNLDPSDPQNGGTFARELRVRGYAGVIFRASGESELGPAIEALFDESIGKGALEWPAFRDVFEAARTRRKPT